MDSDALARATLRALLESEAVGIALVRSPDWTHVLAGAAYERLVGVAGTLGRPITDALSGAVAPRAMLEAVVSTGKPARSPEMLARTEVVNGAARSVHVAFTFMRAREVTPDADGVLVLAQDVSDQVHEQRIGELFAALANDMSGERDETAAIGSSVRHARAVLGADAASIFLVSPDGKRLHGALVGWDWTRTSFVAELESWPNVQRAIAANDTSYLTAKTARLAEEAWFERRGIKAAICAPMTAHGHVLGVLFFDYNAPREGALDLTLAKDVADRCALLVERSAART